MLLEFTVGNYRSFGDDVTLSMVSTALKASDERVNRDNRYVVDDKLTVLRSALLYGANAGGKSNLFKALAFMRDLVMNSSREGQAGDPIGTEPFLLHPDLPEETSTFEVVFRVDGVQYRYGFEVTRARVEHEWLYYIKKREALLFKRDGDRIKVMDAFKAAAPVQPLTRPNALFLSVAAQFNIERATTVLGWFRRLFFLWSFEQGLGYTARKVSEDQRCAAEVGQLLKQLDTGIKAVAAAEMVIDQDALPPEMPVELRALLAEQAAGYQVSTVHDVVDDEGVRHGERVLDLLAHESDGTRKVFGMLGPVLSCLAHGRVMIIDEFDARLHSLLAKALWQLFHGDETNPHGAQLIASTHDTSLLDRRLLRRDQVWFVEKDARAQSQLYSLASFKSEGGDGVRNDASYERYYLAGSFGGVPHPANLKAAVRPRRGG